MRLSHTNRSKKVIIAMAKPAHGELAPMPIPKALQFVFGGVSGMAATFVVQPVDLIKTRMQLSALPGGTGVNMFVYIACIPAKV